jgi:hypothetical protein
MPVLSSQRPKIAGHGPFAGKVRHEALTVGPRADHSGAPRRLWVSGTFDTQATIDRATSMGDSVGVFVARVDPGSP